MSKQAKVLIIGNYLDELKKMLSEKDIIVENYIYSCNLLTMVGPGDAKYNSFADELTHVPSVLNIRKNLKQMLAHNKDEYDSNILYHSVGTEVKYSNQSDWLIISNNLLGYSLFRKDDYIYSDSWPLNDFLKYIRDAKNGFKKMTIPYPETFNWKYYYDKFIDVILSEYTADHIILIKTNSAQWYFDEAGNNIVPFDSKSLSYRNFVEEVDNYLLEKVNCKYIDNTYSFIPPSYNECAFTYARYSNECLYVLADSIDRIIQGNYEEKPIHRSINPNVKKIMNRLHEQMITEKRDIFKLAEKEWHNENQIINNIGNDTDYNDFLLLNEFIVNGIKLSDYIIPNINSLDIQKIISYVKYMKLDINDICSLYYLYYKKKPAEGVTEIIKAMSENPSFRKIITNQRLYDKNISYLSKYPYIQKELDIDRSYNHFILFINNKYGIKIYLNGTDIFKIVRFERELADVNEIFKNDMSCSINQADDLSKSWKFYIKRAKNRKEDVPVKILFKNAEEFYDSLYYINYSELLENERFLLASDTGKTEDYPDFKNTVDLSFLFHDKIRICFVKSGLSDQLCYYFFSVFLEKNTGAEIYLDDIWLNISHPFNGMELNKVIKEDISDKLISNHISKALIESSCSSDNIADILYENGIKDIVAASPYNGANKDMIKKCPQLKIPGSDYSIFIRSDFNIMYSVFLVRPDFLFDNITDYIEFCDYTDELNPQIAKQMNECDSVAIHIRRGDYVNLGWDADMDFYKESMEKLMNIDDYYNKKFFIFSDDIPWCKENLDKIGFDRVQEPVITFVEHNKGEESFRDMQLMTNAKIIIGSNSSFVRLAAFIDKRLELFMCYNLNVMSHFEKIGKRNKYNIGSYKKNYGTDYSSRTPKAKQNK